MRYPRSTAYGIASVATAAVVAWLPVHQAPTLKLRVCEQEDSVNCVWDAKHSGNGVGDSFLVKRDGTVIYVSHHTAHTLLSR
jgi:hypothetical protein